MQQVIDLLKKLKALADRGVGGEKENAQQMLERLMRKHGITMDMLEENQRSRRAFCIADDQRKFFMQIVSSIMGADFTFFTNPRQRRKNKRYSLELTDAEFIEIDAKFHFYWNAYQKDVEIFYKAFVHKNHLYAKRADGEDEDDRPWKDYTPEEKAEMYRMAQMMSGMDKHQFQKQLS